MDEERVVIREFRSNVINFLMLPFLGAIVVFLGTIPFLSGSSLTSGGITYFLFMLALGGVMIVFPFQYRVFLTDNSVIYKRLWGEKEVFYDDVTQIGEIQQRVMNGAPIAINYVMLYRGDGSRFKLSLRNIGADQGQEIIAFISDSLSK